MERHINCCQKVLLANCEKFGISTGMAEQIGALFGGGLAGTGDVCGAVTGALMTMGLRCDLDDPKNKERGQALLKAFANEFGSIYCRDLREKHTSPQGCEILIEFSKKYLIDTETET